jgi:hypothetical protein
MNECCLNLRPDGATRGKWSIIGWEGRWVVCGYSRLQGGSPCLCWLRIVRSGPLNEYLIMYWSHVGFMGPVNWRSSMIVVVGRYPTISLEMSIGIVYGPPTDSSACGITWKMCIRERWDPNQPYGIVKKGCPTWPVRGHVYVMLVRFTPYMIGYWFGSPRHSRIWEIACSLLPLIQMHVYYYDDD